MAIPLHECLFVGFLVLSFRYDFGGQNISKIFLRNLNERPKLPGRGYQDTRKGYLWVTPDPLMTTEYSPAAETNRAGILKTSSLPENFGFRLAPDQTCLPFASLKLAL